MSVSYEIIPIYALQDNYIWMFFDKLSKNAWIIDPGDATPIIEKLEQYHLKLNGILITHHHHDHSGGIPSLINQYGHIPIFGSYKSPLPYITKKVREGDIITCGTIKLIALEIPGHTLDHTAFFGNGWLFSGDTLFSAGCGKVFEGTMEQMYCSLQKLSNLPDDTQLYCGHEYTLANLYFAKHVEPDNPFILEKIELTKTLQNQHKPTLPSLLGEEKKFNPFLRCHEHSIIQAVKNHSGCALESPEVIFSHLREWKNQFR
jgi:hydroxyacylglutathione hydrolase